MTALDREGWRKLADAATEGPWSMRDGWRLRDGPKPTRFARLASDADESSVISTAAGTDLRADPADAEFIAAARTAVPALLDAIDRVLTLCDKAQPEPLELPMLFVSDVRRALGVEADHG